MKSRLPWLYVSLVTLFTVMLTLALYYIISEFLFHEGRYLCLYVGPLGGILFACFLRVRAGLVHLPLQDVLDGLARELIARNLVVEKAGNRLYVRLDQRLGVLVRIRSTSAGSVITYGIWNTPRGAGLYVILSLLIPPLAFIMFLGSLSRVIRYGEEQLSIHIRQTIVQPKEVKTDIRQLLLENLSEARRISLETYEVYRSYYSDYMALASVSGLGVGLFAFLAAAYWFWDNGASLGVIAYSFSLLACLVAGAGFFALLVRMRMKPRLENLGSWLGLLNTAMSAELQQPRDVMTPDSTFELLAKVTDELPGWLEIHRKGMTYREPLMSWVAFVTMSLGLLTLWSSIPSWLLNGDSQGFFVSVLGLASFVAGALLVLSSGKHRKLEAKTFKETWDKKLSELGSRMETLLGGSW